MEPHHFCWTLFFRSESPDSRPHAWRALHMGINTRNGSQRLSGCLSQHPPPLQSTQQVLISSPITSTFHSFLPSLPSLLTYFTLCLIPTNSKLDNNSRGSSNSIYSMKLSLITFAYFHSFMFYNYTT